MTYVYGLAIGLTIIIAISSAENTIQRKEATLQIITAIESNGCVNSRKDLDPLLDNINNTRRSSER